MKFSCESFPISAIAIVLNLFAGLAYAQSPQLVDTTSPVINDEGTEIIFSNEMGEVESIAIHEDKQTLLFDSHESFLGAIIEIADSEQSSKTHIILNQDMIEVARNISDTANDGTNHYSFIPTATQLDDPSMTNNPEINSQLFYAFEKFQNITPVEDLNTSLIEPKICGTSIVANDEQLSPSQAAWLPASVARNVLKAITETLQNELSSTGSIRTVIAPAVYDGFKWTSISAASGLFRGLKWTATSMIPAVFQGIQYICNSRWPQPLASIIDTILDHRPLRHAISAGIVLYLHRSGQLGALGEHILRFDGFLTDIGVNAFLERVRPNFF